MWWLLTLRGLLTALSIVHPRIAGQLALRIFRAPRRHHRPVWEREIADRGKRLRLGSRLAARTWGSGPIVLLVHGWEGRGTQLGRFVDPLVKAGFRAIAFDLPAHGDSSGARTDLVECTETLRKVARDLGPLAGVVAHSFGGAITTLALERGLDAAAVGLISMPSSVENVLTRFGDQIGLRAAARRAFREGIERQTGVKLKDVEIFERVSRLRVPALIVHDRGDREVPFEDAERLHAQWPGSTLVATTGLGHRRILKDDGVIERVVEFVARESGRAAAGTVPLHAEPDR